MNSNSSGRSINSSLQCCNVTLNLMWQIFYNWKLKHQLKILGSPTMSYSATSLACLSDFIAVVQSVGTNRLKPPGSIFILIKLMFYISDQYFCIQGHDQLDWPPSKELTWYPCKPPASLASFPNSRSSLPNYIHSPSVLNTTILLYSQGLRIMLYNWFLIGMPNLRGDFQGCWAPAAPIAFSWHCGCSAHWPSRT